LNCDVSGTADLFTINYFDLKTGKGASLGLSGVVEGIAHPSSAKCSVSFKTGPITTLHLSELLTATGSEVNIPGFDPVSIDGSVDSSLMIPKFRLSLKSISSKMEMKGNINLKEKSYNLKIAGSHIDMGKFTGVGDLGIFTGTLDEADCISRD
jgi:hypothetical protein